MSTQSSDRRPVQVFLDTRGFINVPDKKPLPRYPTDFFKDDNSGFTAHRDNIRRTIKSIAGEMRAKADPVNILHVQMREKAYAKSHRPVEALFNQSNSFSLVGGARIGELLVQCTPDSLDIVEEVIREKAEADPLTVHNSQFTPARRLKVFASGRFAFVGCDTGIGGR